MFLGDDYCALYRDWLAQSCARFGVSVWAYCLMPNHPHLILEPGDYMGLALMTGRTHRLYAGYFSARAGQTGHLFQGRFGSVAMDEDHLMLAARYGERPHHGIAAFALEIEPGMIGTRNRPRSFASLPPRTLEGGSSAVALRP